MKFEIWNPLANTPRLFSFSATLKLTDVCIRKKFKIFIFIRMALTILIKFCGFNVHSTTNNLTLLAFPGKSPEARKPYYNVLRVIFIFNVL